MQKQREPVAFWDFALIEILSQKIYSFPVFPLFVSLLSKITKTTFYSCEISQGSEIVDDKTVRYH